MPKFFNWARAFSRTPEALLIAKEERKARSGQRKKSMSPPREKSRSDAPALVERKEMEQESQVLDSAMEMESLPTFEPRHQIFRMHGVIVRKGEKIHESHGPRGREKKLLCDRRQTIRHKI